MLLGGLRVLCDTGTVFDSSHTSMPYHETLRLTMLVCVGFELNREKRGTIQSAREQLIRTAAIQDILHANLFPTSQLSNFVAAHSPARRRRQMPATCICSCHRNFKDGDNPAQNLALSPPRLLSFSITYFHLNTE